MFVGSQVDFGLRLSSVSLAGDKIKGMRVIRVSDCKEQITRYKLKFETAVVIVISPIGTDTM